MKKISLFWKNGVWFWRELRTFVKWNIKNILYSPIAYIKFLRYYRDIDCQSLDNDDDYLNLLGPLMDEYTITEKDQEEISELIKKSMDKLINEK